LRGRVSRPRSDGTNGRARSLRFCVHPFFLLGSGVVSVKFFPRSPKKTRTVPTCATPFFSFSRVELFSFFSKVPARDDFLLLFFFHTFLLVYSGEIFLLALARRNWLGLLVRPCTEKLFPRPPSIRRVTEQFLEFSFGTFLRSHASMLGDAL